MTFDEIVCTACKGKGKRKVPFTGNTKTYPGHYVNCRYCDSTGSRKHQIFNWMKDPNGDKYIYKEPKGTQRKEMI